MVTPEWMTHQIGALLHKPMAHPSPFVTYALAASSDAAKLVGLRVATGELPDVYAGEADCLAAWRHQPSYCEAKYQPYRIEVEAAPDRLYVRSCKRLVG